MPLDGSLVGQRRQRPKHQRQRKPPQKDPTAPRSGVSRPTSNDAMGLAESVRLTDNPANGHGRAFLIERELEQDGNAALQALIADYLEQAATHERIPMRR
jgi:hypothetical protein